jgi:plasmid maintenance system antidote protein VapI
VSDLHAQFLIEARARMRELGWTHGDLAKKLGISRPRVTELLSAKHSLTAKTMQRVTKALGCMANFKMQKPR